MNETNDKGCHEYRNGAPPDSLPGKNQGVTPDGASHGFPPSESKPLTPRQQNFQRCHTTVMAHVRDGKLAAADALEEIRSQKLFEPEYANFPDYCEKNGIDTKWAYALASFARKRKILADSGITPLPTGEGQTRWLGRSEQAANVVSLWKRAIQPDGTVTGASIDAAYQAYQKEKVLSGKSNARGQGASQENAKIARSGGLLELFVVSVTRRTY